VSHEEDIRGRGRPAQRQPTVLVVATVAGTLGSFLQSHATKATEDGWIVHGAANLDGSDISRDGWASLSHIPLRRGISAPLQLLRSGREIKRLCRELRPDILHVHTPVAAGICRLAIGLGNRRNRPIIVYTAHGFHAHPHGSFLGNLSAILIERLLQPATDKLIVLNNYDLALALGPMGYRAEDVVIMHGIGLHLRHYRPDRSVSQAAGELARRLGLDTKSDFVVAFVGELNDNKRPSDLVSALEHIGDSSLVAIFAGAGDPPAGARDVLRPNVRTHFIGRIADVRQLLELSDLVVSCSNREGLPRSLLEAISFGRPILTSTARGSVDLAVDPAAIYEVGNTVELADRIRQFARDDGMRRRVAAAQRASLELYSFESVYSEVMSLYTRALTEWKGRSL